jgi:hypothetical protein
LDHSMAHINAEAVVRLYQMLRKVQEKPTANPDQRTERRPPSGLQGKAQMQSLKKFDKKARVSVGRFLDKIDQRLKVVEIERMK